METITSNTKTLSLTGEEVHVHFLSTYPYFWLKNSGNGIVLMSLSPNISEGGDGIIEVQAGGSAGTMQGYNNSKTDLYILGSGKVQVMGSEAPNNPFDNDVKGGDKNNEQILLNMPLTTDLSDISGFDRVAEYRGNTPLTINENGIYLYHGDIKIDTEFLNGISDFTVEFDIKINSEGTFNYPFYRRVLTIQYLNLAVSYANYVTTNKFKFEMFNNLTSENARSTYYTYADNHYHHVAIDFHTQNMCALGCVDNKDPFCIKYFAEQKGNIFLGNDDYGLNGYIKNFVIKV